MKLLNWIPWQFIARKAARAYGFADPLDTLQRVRSFSRPSDAHEPIELLRAGFAFHARGIANTKAIQNNLDWIWPYWIERQYDPKDISFVPRAFSFSHINLTQRNWTATGVPGSERYAVVDPRGLVTPFHDSWSIDFWIRASDGSMLVPSQSKECRQELLPGPAFAIRTATQAAGLRLVSTVQMLRREDQSIELSIKLEARSDKPAQLIASVRPYNPEGIQFVDTISVESESREITVNERQTIRLPTAFEAFALSSYEHGDVAHDLELARADNLTVSCPAGMATAAAIARVPSGSRFVEEIRIPLQGPPSVSSGPPKPLDWEGELERTTRLETPEPEIDRQFDISKRVLALLSPDDIFPGPYTYKRFWFRDACLIADALLRTRQIDLCEAALLRFPQRQTKTGYFLSQEGEWDSNGQVLWIYERFESLTGRALPKPCLDTIQPAIDWIDKKLRNAPGSLHDGLFPAGFSAEHFGPNDHYYWDDFWAVGGLNAIAKLLERHDNRQLAGKARQIASRLLGYIEKSLETTLSLRARGKLPASPYRRLDSGAIGSLVADYPLQVFEADDPRVMATADFLYANCVVDGAYFQDMIHSGLNVYLTLDLAQTFLRAGDARWQPLARRCLELASPTGQWPEAIHPRTLGGCMGDGQHAWAAAEWCQFCISRICREERGTLVVGSGVTPSWIQSGKPIHLTALPTIYGEIDVRIETDDPESLAITVDLNDRKGASPDIVVRIPGYETQQANESFRCRLAAANEDALRK